MFESSDIVFKNKDEKFSEELSEYIKGVKIDVFVDTEGIVCSKKMADVKTILGPTSITDLYDTLRKISNGIAYIPNVFAALNFSFYSIWFLLMLIYHFFRPQLNSQFNLNDDKKSFTVTGMSYIPIFINPKLINILNHDELISVCLSSIFDHSQYTRDTFRKVFINSRWQLPLYIARDFVSTLKYSKFVNDVNNSDNSGVYPDNVYLLSKDKLWTSFIITTALGIVFMNILNKVLYINNDIKSDNFVIIIGRGDSLISAYRKMKTEADKYETILSKLAKYAQKLIGVHLGNTPYDTRIRNIEKYESVVPSEKLMNIDKKFINIVKIVNM